MRSFIFCALFCVLGFAVAKPLTELKFDLSGFDPENVNCSSKIDFIDECGLQQGFSHRFNEFPYPTNFTHLMSSCKRQSDALKCLKANAKCLPALSKQVLLAMVSSRVRYNKKICNEKQTEAATKLLEFTQCMSSNKTAHEKGLMAEISSITIPEAILNTKIDSVQDRLRHSCCSVAKVKKEFMDATVPHCKQYSQVASDMIDSYVADTVGIICPDLETKILKDCDKLPKLSSTKPSNAKFFIRPIINVIQTLA